ncbi:hypothetical protein SDC9_161128 [bioreactor metagenome]|uniref:Uncharacterized protein n=1 Tax=bioreactor metagenome TaxID=1076179 RepID=A0A645FJT3_9ZZZZ
MHAQIVRAVQIFRPPDLQQQLAMRQHLAMAGNQRRQQTELYGRQVHGHSVTLDIVRRQIHLHRAETRTVAGLVCRRCLLAAAQHHAQPGQQLGHAKGLGQVIIGTGVQRRHLFLFPLARGQDQNRQLAPAAQLGNHGLAIGIGQPQVQHHGVGLSAGGLDQAAPGGFGLEHLPAFVLQCQADKAADAGVVFNQQNAGGGARHVGISIDARDCRLIRPWPVARARAGVR